MNRTDQHSTDVILPPTMNTPEKDQEAFEVRLLRNPQLAITETERQIAINWWNAALAYRAAPQAPHEQPASEDAARLEWLLHRVSGVELRRIGVVVSSGGLHFGRTAIDAARAPSGEAKGGDRG